MGNHAADRHSVDHRFLVLKQLALLAMGDVSSDSAGMGNLRNGQRVFRGPGTIALLNRKDQVDSTMYWMYGLPVRFTDGGLLNVYCK